MGGASRPGGLDGHSECCVGPAEARETGTAAGGQEQPGQAQGTEAEAEQVAPAKQGKQGKQGRDEQR